MCLQLAPNIFHRIQLGRVGGKVFHPHSGILPKKLTHFPAPMSRQTIPHQNYPSPKMPKQIAEEFNHLFRLHAPVEKPEINLAQCYSSDHRQGLPIEGILQHRRMPSRRPGSHGEGAQTHTGFIQKHDRCPVFPGVFLSLSKRSFSNAELRRRPAPVLSPSAAGNSSPTSAAISTCGWDDIPLRIIS